MFEIDTSGRSANQRKSTQINGTQIWSFGWLGVNKGGLGLVWLGKANTWLGKVNK